jgi:hypothetical protein
VKRSLQIEPPICGMITGFWPVVLPIEAAIRVTQPLSGSVLLAKYPPLFSSGGSSIVTFVKPLSSRC